MIKLTKNRSTGSSGNEGKHLEEMKESEKITVEYLKNEELGKPRGTDSIGECSVCLDNLSDIMLPCLHAFCSPCIELWQARQSNCPVCRSEILTKCSGMTTFTQTGVDDEFYCVINSGDNIDELADEISMRVSAATRFIIDSKPYSGIVKIFSKVYTVA